MVTAPAAPVVKRSHKKRPTAAPVQVSVDQEATPVDQTPATTTDQSAPAQTPPVGVRVKKSRIGRLATSTLAWARCGVEFSENEPPRSASQALVEASLDVKLEVVPIPNVAMSDGTPVTIPNRAVVVRAPTSKDPNARVVGYVHSKYPVLQSMDLASFLDPITTNAPVAAIGQVDQGAGMFWVMDFGMSTIAGQVIREYFLVADYHDGRRAFQTIFAPTWDSSTVLMTGMRTASLRVAVPHTHSTFQATSTFYVKFLAQVQKARDAVIHQLSALADVFVDDVTVTATLRTIYANPAKPRAMVLAQAVQDDNLVVGDAQAQAEVAERVRVATERWTYYCDRLQILRSECEAVYRALCVSHPTLANTGLGLYLAIAKFEDHRSGSASSAQSTIFGARARTKEQAFRVISDIKQ